MVTEKRKICIITGTRAEYGLLKPLIELFYNSEKFELQLVPSCMHLSPEFGLTIEEIKKDGYPISRTVDMLLSSNNSVGITKSFGLGAIGFADVFNDLEPDIIILLGDRFEALAASVAALFANIPLAHIHGGEITRGCFDDNIRHSITKMSQLHFVASSEYAKRVVQLGETPQKVFNVGGLGVDLIKNTKFLSKKSLESSLKFKFLKKNILITFHPVTLESDCKNQFQELIKSLSKLKNIGMIFTMPNADKNSKEIDQIINSFCNNKNNAKYFKSLGTLRYLSCMKIVDGIVGNSSSGLLEAPSFKIGTINIGNRQEGRLKSKSVIDTIPDEKLIDIAFKKLFSSEFKINLENVVNPYGKGGACKKIFEIISKVDLEGITKKEFYDLYS